jgi:hypothetical protein
MQFEKKRPANRLLLLDKNASTSESLPDRELLSARLPFFVNTLAMKIIEKKCMT